MYTLYVTGCPSAGYSTWGIVLTERRKRLKTQAGNLHDGSTARALLVGLITGLSLLKTPSMIRVFTRSDYLLKGVKQWLPIWTQRNWRNNDGRLVAHAELWQEVMRLLQFHEVHIMLPASDDSHEEALQQLVTLTQNAVSPYTEPYHSSLLILMIGSSECAPCLEERIASAVLYAKKQHWLIISHDVSSGVAGCIIRLCCELGVPITTYSVNHQPENALVSRSIFGHHYQIPFSRILSPHLQPYLRYIHADDETPLYDFIHSGNLVTATCDAALIEDANRVYCFSDDDTPPLIYTFTHLMTQKPCIWVRSLPASASE